MSIVETIRREGRPLGGPNRQLLAFVDFFRLRKKVGQGYVLVVVYGCEELGFSASAISGLHEFAMIRRSQFAQVEYYAIKQSLLAE